MARKIHSFWRLLLGTLITVLGVTACKKVLRGDDIPAVYGPPPPAPMNKMDSIRAGLLPPSEQEVKPVEEKE